MRVRRTPGRAAAAAVAVALLVGVVAGAATPAAAHGGGSDGVHAEALTPEDRRDIARLRVATKRFHDLDAALSAGFGELADAAGLTCIEDPGGAGGMGVHYVNGALVGDGEIDALRPEVVLYDFSSGNPRLVAVEFVVFVADWGVDREPPELFGQTFHLLDETNRYGLPPFYELHVWNRLHNPSGMFEDWNPLVDCP